MTATGKISRFIDIPSIKCRRPFPTYFISHGGPTLIRRSDAFTDKGAYDALETIGSEIKQLKPDYIVVVSGHYQSDESNTIEISVNKDNNNEYENKLIYDFYGFDKDMYAQKFKSRSSPFISLMMYDELRKHGFKSKIVDRGIDHGVWVPFKVAFGDQLDIPLIQISLPFSDDFNESYKLGKVLKVFRDKLIWDPEKKVDLKGLVVCSGTSVHNLRDLQRSFSYPGRVMPYVKQFNDLIDTTFKISTPLTMLQNLNNLKNDANHRQLLYQAHPSLDHFLPLIVAAGTNDGSTEFETLYNNQTFSLGWGMYKLTAHLPKESPEPEEPQDATEFHDAKEEIAA